MGIGWNLGFSSATVLLTRVYDAHDPQFKANIQANNDFAMFFISGATAFSTGYIYNAGGAMLQGWKTVNYVVMAMIGIISIIMIPASIQERRRNRATRKQRQDMEENPTSANTSQDNTSVDVIATMHSIQQEETGFELAYDLRSIHSKV